MNTSNNNSNPNQHQNETSPKTPPRKFRDIAKKVKKEIGHDNANIVAAGIAFYAFLAIFPTLIATISIYGLVMEPQTVENQLQKLTEVLPEQARELIGRQLTSIAKTTSTALSWGLLISILAALWSANKGMKSLFQGINIAFDVNSTRGFFKINAMTLLFTLAAVILTIIIAALVMALPAIMNFLGLPPALKFLLSAARWVLLALAVLFALAALYRFAPDRHNVNWRWITWGTGIAAALWLIGSWAFSYYVANFGSYNKVYGSLAAVIILMLWLLLSCFTILLGAEIDSTMQPRA